MTALETLVKRVRAAVEEETDPTARIERAVSDFREESQLADLFELVDDCWGDDGPQKGEALNIIEALGRERGLPNKVALIVDLDDLER